MTSAEPRTKPMITRFAHIDALRAFAVMLVVVAHAGLGDVVPGGSGVTIFFAISGFIISYLLLREKSRTAKFDILGFYTRRAIKIFPPLIVAVALPSVIYALLGNYLAPTALPSQMFFAFNWVYLNSGREVDVLPGSDVVWSLAIEEQFYIAFALIWLAFIRSRHWYALTMFLSIAASLVPLVLRLFIAINSEDSDRIYYGTDTRIDSIAMGVVLALVIYRWQSRGATLQSRVYRLFSSPWCLVLAGVTYLVSLTVRDDVFRDTLRFWLQAVAAVLVIGFGMMPDSSLLSNRLRRISRWRPISILGLASYSIYLCHLSAMLLIAPMLNSWPAPLAVLVNIVVGTGTGLVCYQLVERPILALRARAQLRPAIHESR